jgi:syntaxin 16
VFVHKINSKTQSRDVRFIAIYNTYSSSFLYTNSVSLLRKEQGKRLVSKFNEREIAVLDRNIAKISKEILSLLKEAEDYIKDIGAEKVTSSAHQMMKDNIKIHLVSHLKEFTKKVKANQDEYMVKYKELVGDYIDYNEYEAKKSLHSGSNNTSSTGDQSFLKEKGTNDELMHRGKEIDLLVNNILQLGEIMNDFQALVLVQGTILDRIDHNIEVALDNTIKGHEELKKANENLKSNCARNASLILTAIICIEVILLIFKLA